MLLEIFILIFLISGRDSSLFKQSNNNLHKKRHSDLTEGVHEIDLGLLSLHPETLPANVGDDNFGISGCYISHVRGQKILRHTLPILDFILSE